MGLRKRSILFISLMQMYKLLHCLMLGEVRTSSSKSPRTSLYTAVSGMARSMMASMMACTTSEASQDSRKMVPGLLRRVTMGRSMSPAETSKKEMTVLSAVRKMETCSAETARLRGARMEFASM